MPKLIVSLSASQKAPPKLQTLWTTRLKSLGARIIKIEDYDGTRLSFIARAPLNLSAKGKDIGLSGISIAPGPKEGTLKIVVNLEE